MRTFRRALYREPPVANVLAVRPSGSTTLIDAAVQMREYDIGDVLITEQDWVLGVFTDRDIVVRVLAADKDPARNTAREIASGRLVTWLPMTR